MLCLKREEKRKILRKYTPQFVNPVSEERTWRLYKEEDCLFISRPYFNVEASILQIFEQGSELICCCLVV